MAGGSSRSLTYYDFMGVGTDYSTTIENPPTERENLWPIKRELTALEIRDDAFYMEKEAFQAYVLPLMPRAIRDKLAKGLVVEIAAKDERCVFYVMKLFTYEGYYVLTSYRSQSQTFIRSRELVAGQSIWLRWINGYMELKVLG
ncbi:hypothetical protein Nepgr_025275 [Nepenthes gracilis]|uniref:Uncharacterized protein n=1 Tax=Nepenthes gracilis TaxID=150966 RepID=A0AAD3T7F0_NEPGR|nr:hypothetical protein Nepgr_025275 [Nepenthes gracilis]